MKIYCNFNNHSYTAKPSNLPAVQSELSVPTEIEVPELAYKLVHGRNVRPAAIYGTSDNDFKSQQLFMIDFDNTDRRRQPFPPERIVSPQKAVQMASDSGLKPCFGYYTFSHSETVPKFRLAFLMDRPVTDMESRDKIQLAIMQVFDGLIDSSCKNASRIFFGSQAGSLVYSDFDALNSADELLDREIIKPAIQRMKPKKAAKTGTSGKSLTNVELIRAHDAAGLRKRLGIEEETVFNNREEFFNYLYHQISISELLGVEKGESFCCLFHDDFHPSASIFKGEKSGGIWQYKCFACGCLMNIKQVVESLGDFSSESRALSFIKDVYGLKISETNWSKEQIENIDSILYCIRTRGEDGFSQLCPTASYNTRYAMRIYETILEIAKRTIYPEDYFNGNVVFSITVKQIALKSGVSKEDKVRAYLKMFTYHKMLSTLSDDEIPKPLLAKALQARKGADHKRASFFSIPSWVYQHTRLIEQQGQKWKANGYRLKGVSYDMFFRAEGAAVAQWLYPQYKIDESGDVRGTTEKADARHYELQEVIVRLIQEKGYCTEREVIQQSKMSNRIAELQLKRSLTDILNCNNLVKRKCSKELKERFGIECAGYPFIIFPE